jgi:hypothetical protein
MRKEILIPFLLLILGLVFIIINIIVYFSVGNPWVVAKKLKVGAMILSLTGMFACGTNNTNDLTCYKSPKQSYKDSIAEVKKQDSIKTAGIQKHIDDSIAAAKEKKRKKDSIAKIKKRNPVRPVCYGAPRNTCYTQVKKN